MGTSVPPALWVGIVVVLVIAALLAVYLRRRGQPAKAAGQAAPGPQPAAAWRPPVQPEPPSPASGPSLAAGIMLIRSEAAGLEVIWNALVDGDEAVAVQWGAPEICLRGDTLELRYVYEPEEPAAADFQAPRARVYQPGEIVSRAVQVRWPQIGRSPAGLKIAIAVGYGPADGLAQAASSQDAYLAWQRVAAARARPVPAAT